MSINIFPKGITIYHGKCVSANRSRLLGIHGVGCGLDLGDLDHSLYIFCKRPRCGTCNAAWLPWSFMLFARGCGPDLGDLDHSPHPGFQGSWCGQLVYKRSINGRRLWSRSRRSSPQPPSAQEPSMPLWSLATHVDTSRFNW